MQATIHNEFLTLTVDTHGAEAVSLKNAAGEELLWQADPAIWKRHAPILFPWTGKLVDGTFTAKGKTWKGGQHGFARDLEHTLLRAEGDTIQLELRADDAIKAERFPYDFMLTSTFRLEGKTVHHTLQVTNPGTEELRFGIGFHPAFNVPFDEKHTTTDYEFCFDRPESPMVIDAGAGGLLSGKYGRDGQSETGGRRLEFDFPPVNKERAFDCVDVMRTIAESKGVSVAQIALAWLLHQKAVTSVIIGAKRVEQLDDNIAATGISLSEPELKQLDAVSALPREYPGWMLERQGEYRRNQLMQQ